MACYSDNLMEQHLVDLTVCLRALKLIWLMAYPSVSHLEYHSVLPMVHHAVHSLASLMAHHLE